jgi:hypothetical protein
LRCAGSSDAAEVVVFDEGAVGVDVDRCEDVGVNVVRCRGEAGGFSEVLSRESDCVACLDCLGDTVGDSDCDLVPVFGVLLALSAMAAS